MASTIMVTELFRAEPRQVWRTLTDLDRAHAWMPNFVSIERAGAGPLRIGDTWKETRRVFGRLGAEHFAVVEARDGELLELLVDGRKGASRHGVYRFRWLLSPESGGCRVTHTCDLEQLTVQARLLRPLLSMVFRMGMKENLRAVQRHVESATPAGMLSA